jgi:hypothetical protein
MHPLHDHTMLRIASNYESNKTLHKLIKQTFGVHHAMEMQFSTFDTNSYTKVEGAKTNTPPKKQHL